MAERDMRIEELAFRLHISGSTVARWLAGKTAPTPNLGRQLGELFEVDWRGFYAEKDEPKAANT